MKYIHPIQPRNEASELIKQTFPSFHPAKYPLHTLIKASRSQYEDYSLEELQYLKQKLEGINIERKVRPTDKRYNLIVDFYHSFWEWLQIPTNDQPFKSIYAQYKRAFLEADSEDIYRKGKEPLNKAAFDAYVTLDFLRVGRGVCDDGQESWQSKFLAAIEESFKTGIMPPKWESLPEVINLYGKNAMRIVKFFRAVKYNSILICPKGEDCLLVAILMLLELYQSLPGDKKDEFLRRQENKIFTLYQHNMMMLYGHLSPRMYQSFLIIDLYNLEKRLKDQGGTTHEMLMVNIIGQFLAQGELPESARTWISENVSARSAKYAPESIYFQDLNLEPVGDQIESDRVTTLTNTDATLIAPKPNTEAKPPAYSDNLQAPKRPPIKKEHGWLIVDLLRIVRDAFCEALRDREQRMRKQGRRNYR